MPRLDRGIQYDAADVGRASSSTPASGILDRPVKPGEDTVSGASSEAPYDNRISSNLRPSLFSSFFTALDATTSPSLA